MLVGWSGQAWAQATKTAGGPMPAPVNVLQDCWTTDIDLDDDAERELYTFDVSTTIELIWKQKLLVSCSAYRVVYVIYDECLDGKPSATMRPVQHLATANFGPLSPIPGVPEPLISISFPASALGPGRYEWAMAVECDDTNGVIAKDGDIDDFCGLNPGLPPDVVPPVPIFGPDPIQFLDPDPGGSPPGRGPGEHGTTRPWCFDVTGVVPPGGAAKAPPVDYSRPGFIHQVLRPEDSIKGDGVMDLQEAMEALRQKREGLQLQQLNEEVPDQVNVLIENHPNPFTAETTINYTLDQAGRVKLTIYDALGRKVRVLVDTHEAEGTHRAVFDGAGLSAGVYFYYLEVEQKSIMGKMVLQK